MQEGKVVVQKAKQIAEKRIEANGKGKRERYIQLNAEFQRIARRDKKTLKKNAKKTELNNRMKKTRDLFKKIRDIKGTFHLRMGTIKDRNSKDLAEAKEIKKMWQEYTEEYTKKVKMTQINTMVQSHLELGILECEVKWASGSNTMNKASRGEGLSRQC